MKLNKMMNLHFAHPTNIINPPALFKYSKNSGTSKYCKYTYFKFFSKV